MQYNFCQVGLLNTLDFLCFCYVIVTFCHACAGEYEQVTWNEIELMWKTERKCRYLKKKFLNMYLIIKLPKGTASFVQDAWKTWPIAHIVNSFIFMLDILNVQPHFQISCFPPKALTSLKISSIIVEILFASYVSRNMLGDAVGWRYCWYVCILSTYWYKISKSLFDLFSIKNSIICINLYLLIRHQSLLCLNPFSKKCYV